MAGVINQPNSTKTLGQGSTFGAPPNNSNREPLDEDNFFQTNDATPVNNVQSPQAVTTTALKLTTPKNATKVILIADAAVRVSEFADMSQYATIPANMPITLNMARQGALWLATGTGTANVSFIYQTL